MSRRPIFEAPPVDVPPGESVSAMIAASAARDGAHTALVCDDLRLTWSEFDGRVNRVANALIAGGLGHGDRVALLGYNGPEYAIAFIGTLRAGGCVVPLSTMAPPQALERMIGDSGALFFLLAAETRELARPFAERLDGVLDGGRIALDFEAPGWTGFDAWTAAAAATDPGVAVGLDDAFNIIYSSGTTGAPKGILHSNGVRTQLCRKFVDYGFGADTVTVLSTPLYSNTTIVTLLPTLAHGGTVVLMRRFDTQGFLRLVEREQATHTMLVPVQYRRLMEDPGFEDHDLSSMRLKLSTSAPFPAALKGDVVERFPGRLVEIYGLTEGGGATVLDCSEFPHKLGSVGQPGLGTTVKVIDAHGNEAAPGAMGEIVGRSSSMMSGYFKAPEKTAAMLWHNADGLAYFRSGDMGRFDADGFLWLGDRIKDMIISGGLNIYATDLELVLAGHPGIADVAVIAVPSERWGETPLALVVPRGGAEATPDQVLAWANARLGKAERLWAVEFRDELPRSSIGKVLKRALREPYWEGG